MLPPEGTLRRSRSHVPSGAQKPFPFRKSDAGHLSFPFSQDDDRGEEWERHEALHEDVTRQERTTERLFEEEIELKWEKGGSGLVFYTDAQFWQEEEGGKAGYLSACGCWDNAGDGLTLKEQRVGSV